MVTRNLFEVKVLEVGMERVPLEGFRIKNIDKRYVLRLGISASDDVDLIVALTCGPHSQRAILTGCDHIW